MKAFTFLVLLLLSVPSLGKEKPAAPKPSATPATKPGHIVFNLEGVSAYKDTAGKPVACQVYLEMDEQERIVNFRAETNSRVKLGMFSGAAVSILDKALSEEGETVQSEFDQFLDQVSTHEMEFPASYEEIIKVQDGDQALSEEEIKEIKKQFKLQNEASRGKLYARLRMGGMMFNKNAELTVRRDRKTGKIESVEFLQSVKEGFKNMQLVECNNLQPVTVVAAKLEDKTAVKPAVAPAAAPTAKKSARN
jgi:CRISPR/Cas system endoribonuclease Cas6 (RAMP superfamily)